MYLLPGLVIAALVMITAAAVTLRRWARARLQAAQWRLARETWQEMAASPGACTFSAPTRSLTTRPLTPQCILKR